MKVSATSYLHASHLIGKWACERASRYVCLATVNQVMEAYDSAHFQSVMNNADLVTPDGMPLVWASRLLGRKSTSRVYGPDLMAVLLGMAAARALPIGFYGAAPRVLDQLIRVITDSFPALKIAYACSPPFRPFGASEDQQIVDRINSSGATILFVGLGSPKQDCWMAAHRDSIQAVMVGVGAAFDFLAGAKPQAPRWMMPLGLEWLFRLVTEPRRLWKRYLKHNPRFVALFALQLLRWKCFSSVSLHARS